MNQGVEQGGEVNLMGTYWDTFVDEFPRNNGETDREYLEGFYSWLDAFSVPTKHAEHIADLMYQLAEATRKIELYKKTVWPSQENEEARRLLTNQLAEARTCNLCRTDPTGHPAVVCDSHYRHVLNDRDALQAKLVQAREVVEAARRLMTNLHTGKVEGMLTDELYAALAALEAGKEADPDYKALYHELLFAVGNIYEGETRHQTALRYIRQREQAHGSPSMTKEAGG